MPKPVRKSYTPEEKAQLVAEIERRYKAGGCTYKQIARELGITDSSYHNWIKAGIQPAPLNEPLPARRPPVPRPYEPAERERLVAEVDKLKASGLGLLAACRKLGISDKSYRLWTRPAPAMRPVEITALVPAMPAAPVAPETTLSLVTPDGYRIEGLSVASAAELLRALG